MAKMIQPRKYVLREQLALAAAEIERLGRELEMAKLQRDFYCAQTIRIERKPDARTAAQIEARRPWWMFWR